MSSRKGRFAIIPALLACLALAAFGATSGLAKTGDTWGNASGKWKVAGAALAEGKNEPIKIATGTGAMTLTGAIFSESYRYEITCKGTSLEAPESTIFNKPSAKGYALITWSGCEIPKPAGCSLAEPTIETEPLQFELKTVGSKQYALFKARSGETFAIVPVDGCAISGVGIVLSGSFGAELNPAGVEAVNQPFRFSQAATLAAGGHLFNVSEHGVEPALQQEALVALAG